VVKNVVISLQNVVKNVVISLQNVVKNIVIIIKTAHFSAKKLAKKWAVPL
jgi:hypothetical protein